MKMKKSDIVVVAFMYAVCLLFGGLNTQLKPEAQTYPWFVIGLLFFLTTLYLIKMIIAAKKYGVEFGFDELFEGFLGKQFFPIAAMVLGYVVVMYFFGFYIASFLFFVLTLSYLKVPKWQIVLVVVVMFALTYGAFTMFLGVKLPQGTVIKALLKLLR